MSSKKTDIAEETVLEIKGLTKVFSDFWRRAKVKAVNDLDLDVRKGEVFGLLGPNGSGKSTTIKIILGLLHPTSGSVRIFNKTPGNVGIKKKIGYLPEESYLYNYLTPRETLTFYARLFNMGRKMRLERIDQLLDMAGLTHAADRSIGEFSKGMARRVGLAQALINNPDLVVLDEPTSGLDPIGCRQVKDLIMALAKQGKTVILSSHLLADVEDVCDRIAILYNGSMRAHGMVSELLKVEDSCRFTMPVMPPEQTQKVMELIRDKTGTMANLDHPSRDLEQFFLHVVEQAHGDLTEQSGVARAGNLPEYLRRI